ncbi:MAG: tRNA (guanosine(37)-N1)-methyltransferase TrmD [Lachnospiraceae bacterium]
MNFYILTLFPEMIESGLGTSIIGRAADAGLLYIEAVNIRDFTNDPHRHVDDYPYGGGAGMVIQAQPVFDCFTHVCEKIKADSPASDTKPRVIYTSPAGRMFNQEMARELAGEENLIILCGHYEGVDQRALDLIGAEDVSIGDYVLTGGELASMVIVDAVSRMVPGVLTNEESGKDESFSDRRPSEEFTKKARREIYGNLLEKDKIKLLEHPQYTRPEEFMGMRVPEVLLSGHHVNIEKWRRQQSVERTRRRRPDLLN